LVRHEKLGCAWGVIDPATAAGSQPLTITLQGPGRLRGRILADDGTGLAGVEVKLLFRDVPEEWHRFSSLLLMELYGPFPPWQRTSDENGGFLLEGMPGGAYAVRFNHPDYPSSAHIEIDVAISADTVWEGIMPEGLTVRGTVRNELGEAVPDAWVRVERPRRGLCPNDVHAEWGSRIEVPVTYDGQGSFSAQGLPPGPLRLHAKAPGYRLTKVVLEPCVTPIEIVLEDQPGPEQIPALKGTETLAFSFRWKEYAIDAASVYFGFYWPDTSDRAFERPGEVRGGKVTLEKLPPGIFDVVVDFNDYEAVVLKDVAIPGSPILDLSLTPAPVVTLKIRADGSVRTVRVLDGESHMLRQAPVQADGCVRIWGLGSGEYYLRGRGADGEDYVCDHAVALSADSTVTVHLTRPPQDVKEMAQEE
jgi:hypothetical protein